MSLPLILHRDLFIVGLLACYTVYTAIPLPGEGDISIYTSRPSCGSEHQLACGVLAGQITLRGWAITGRLTVDEHVLFVE
jgi:hypothetical protein